jgi:peptidase E
MVHLVGGGPSALIQTRRHFKTAIAALHKKKPLVGYVGAASQDNVAFRKMISLALAGAQVEPVHLASARAKISAARQLLDDCDLVFVSGGDVDLGMRIVRERGVDAQLRDLARAGKPFLGVSAGSIMLAERWVRFAGDDDERGELFDCLGIAPVMIDCHDEEGGWTELRALLAHLPDGSVGYGVPSKGCLRVKEGKLTAMGVPLPRFRAKKGGAAEDGALSPLHSD